MRESNRVNPSDWYTLIAGLFLVSTAQVISRAPSPCIREIAYPSTARPSPSPRAMGAMPRYTSSML